MFRKFCLILFIGLISIFSSFAQRSQQTWSAIRAGYGNETGGFGIAVEDRADNFGYWAGLGYFQGELGVAFGGRFWLLDISPSMSLTLSAGAGLLGIYYEYTYQNYQYTYHSEKLWGPFAMIGVYGYYGGSLVADAQAGIGWHHERGIIFVIQSSVGFIIMPER